MNNPSNSSEFRVAIIGGGAAGFFCAANLELNNKKVEIVIFEKTKKLLSKVLISGGGRCNVTNSQNQLSVFLDHYPRGKKELRSVFTRFSNSDTINWFTAKGINLKTEPDGRVFPESNRSETIIECLTKSAGNSSVKLGHELIRLEKRDSKFNLKFHVNDGFNKEILDMEFDYVVVSSGGRTQTDGYNFLHHTHHKIIDPVPSLFTFNIVNKELTALMGLSVSNAKVKLAGTSYSETGALLITHWGLSGPAVLKLSSHAARFLKSVDYKIKLNINWLNDSELELRNLLIETKNEFASSPISKQFPSVLPKRLLNYLFSKAGVDEQKKWSEISKKEINKLVSVLLNDEYDLNGKTTFKEEFVTCGGVELSEVNFASMESKKCAGLFFCGEVLDIDALTGGFNFQAAWSTAFIAAQSIKERINKSII